MDNQPDQLNQPPTPPSSAPEPAQTPPPSSPQPIHETQGGMIAAPARRRFRWWHGLIAGIVLLGVVGAGAGVLYLQALRPVDSSNQRQVAVDIVSGSTPDEIATTLKENDLIRHTLAFSIHTRLHGTQNNLQAGTYQLSPSQSTPDIATALAEGPGSQDIEVTFLPGATLAQGKQALLDAGFNDQEINEAFNARYDHPLFADRPASADLEGYLYGETHRFAADAKLIDVLERFFDDYYEVITEGDLETKFKSQGFTLYEGITLASIIQKEVSGDGDSRQVSQVFHKRLAEGMPLGADATFVYAATKDGETPSVEYPSPYNTRIHDGLPPGPISTPGVEAIQAAAEPAKGDYLYFVSGDDGKNHFSMTEEEHIQKTRQYCQENCALF